MYRPICKSGETRQLYISVVRQWRSKANNYVTIKLCSTPAARPMRYVRIVGRSHEPDPCDQAATSKKARGSGIAVVPNVHDTPLGCGGWHRPATRPLCDYRMPNIRLFDSTLVALNNYDITISMSIGKKKTMKLWHDVIGTAVSRVVRGAGTLNRCK